MFRDFKHEQPIPKIGFLDQFLNPVVQSQMTAEQLKHILYKNSNKSLFQATKQQISS
jgi:hypothetical protein